MSEMRARIAAAMVVVTGAWVGAGCNLVLGLDDPTTSGGITATGGAGAGGAGGATGGGGATGTVCIPGATQPCKYSGPASTENVGACHAGAQTCNADGTGYGACTGEVVPVKEICGNQEDEDCDGVSCGGTIWSKLWGDAGDQTVGGVAVSPTGDIVLSGKFEGSLPFGSPQLVNATPTSFVAAADGTGTPGGGSELALNSTTLISRSAGMMNVRYGIALEIDRLDSIGSVTWSQSLSGAGMTATLAALDFDGAQDGILAGKVISNTTFGASSVGPNGGFLLKLKHDTGAVEWAKKFGMPGGQTPERLALDPSYNILVSGRYTGPLLYAGDPSGDGNDLFVISFTPAGDPSWGLGIPMTLRGHALTTAPDGSAIVAGRFSDVMTVKGSDVASSGPADLFVLRVSAAGVVSWVKTFGGPAFVPSVDAGSATASLGIDSAGNILVVSRGSGTINFGQGNLGSAGEVSDFLVKMDKDGNVLWSRRFGPVAPNGGCSVAVAMGDEPVLACSVETASIDFGNGPLTGKGGLDIVVARFAP